MDLLAGWYEVLFILVSYSSYVFWLFRGPAGSSSLSVAKIAVFLCFLDFVCLVSPPQFLLQQHTKNMTASPPPTDINHSNTPDGTEPPPAATVIEPAVRAPATPRIPTAVRDAQRSSLAASRAAIQSRKLAAAAQSIIRLYRIVSHPRCVL